MGMLDGKSAVITGAGRGLGRACAEYFAAEGARVLAVDFSGAEKETAAAIGDAVVPFHADLTHDDEVEAMIETAVATFGGVDALLNNAATLARRSDDYLALDEYDVMMPVNLRAVLVCTRFAVEAMIDAGRGGSIVNFTTAGAFNVEQMAPINYMAAKAGVHAFTKAIAVEYGPYNIRCNALAPGFSFSYAETERRFPPELLDEMAAKAPLGRVSEPREQAQVAAFLASDLSSFVTGAIIPVDGGWSLRLA
jgi:NAD(P)-dependent dehydrogenase (short-subunit alcohol dehydrogenase family)